MTSWALAVVVQTMAMAPGGETYAEAHKVTTETGRPLLVLVGADWCPACQELKNQVIPQLRKGGVLRKVAFAIVNLDREQELGSKLTGGGPIPQLLLFRRTSDGWRTRQLIGGQDVETVKNFLAEDVQDEEGAASSGHSEPPASLPSTTAGSQPSQVGPASSGRRIRRSSS
jgi:thioredoxin-like negative regulator of GroEL